MDEPPWDSVRGCLFMKYVRFMENDEKDVVKYLYESLIVCFNKLSSVSNTKNNTKLLLFNVEGLNQV